MYRKKPYNFSKLFCLGVIVALSLNYVFNGILKNYLILNPNLISSNFEFWRLISFPLAGNTIVGTFLFCFTFWLISPKIEELIQNGIYPVMILLVIILQGIITTLVFWKSDIHFAGAEGITFFVLTLYTLIQRRKRVIVWKMSPIRLEFLFVMLLCSWVSFVVLQAFISKNTSLLITNGIAATFGLLSGTIVFIQIKIIENFRTGRIGEINHSATPNYDNLSPALIEKSELKKQANRFADEPAYYFDGYYSEDRLNEILDKMIATGNDSITDEERRYLKEYSEFLKT